jgi:hypothetical protein
MEEKIIIHGSEWKMSDVKDTVDALQGYKWEKNTWKRRAALVHKKGGITSAYYGQKYDPEKIDLVKNGWSHDHCELCFWGLCESNDPEHGIGYSSGNTWICTECYEKLIRDLEHL